MTDADIRTVLKCDLQFSTTAYDTYLDNIITSAKSYIATEGITLDTTVVADAMLVEMYSAYLYRQRKDAAVQMPRHLRWALNNRLMQEKGAVTDG